jgi:hypothetical protein
MRKHAICNLEYQYSILEISNPSFKNAPMESDMLSVQWRAYLAAPASSNSVAIWAETIAEKD